MNITDQTAKILDKIEPGYGQHVLDNKEIQVYATENGYRWRDSRFEAFSDEYRIELPDRFELYTGLGRHIRKVMAGEIKEFQIKLSYGDGIGAYLYFTVATNPPLEELKELAIAATTVDWVREKQGVHLFSGPTPARPTINVAEYAKGCKVKGGIRFKTKWR